MRRRLFVLVLGVVGLAGIVGVVPPMAGAQEVPNPTCDSGSPATIPGVIGCPTTTTTRPPTTTTVPPPASEPAPALSTEPEESLPTELVPLSPPLDLPSLDVATGGPMESTPPDLSSPTRPTVTPVVLSTNPGFAYPIIFLVPLVLLALVGYLGRALTAPLREDHR